MTCGNCGSQLAEGTRFCSNCGAALGPSSASSTQPVTPPLYRAGRGGIILTLGILSLVITGPITGIPAWIMGHRDIRNIDAGLIAQSERGMTTAGMVLGIIGTCLGTIVFLGVVIAIVVVFVGRGYF